jgi:prevent-host-death family protein
VLDGIARHTLGSMSETVSFGEAVARLARLADRVEAGHERIVVTRNGRPSFVLVNPDDLEALEDALASILRRSHPVPIESRCASLRSVPPNEPAP